MINKLMTKTILIDGMELVSDIQSSKNVIKISDKDTAVIYITPSINTFIRPKDIDALIMDLSWGCDYIQSRCDYIESECDVYGLDLEMVVGKSIVKEPRYVSATLSAKDVEDAKRKVKRYKLDPTLPIIKQFLKGKKVKIFLHRYLMGMFSLDSVKSIKNEFGISDEEFNVKGLSSVQVHHMDGDPLENYSDKLIIVNAEKHSDMKRKDPSAYNFYGGQFENWRIGDSVCLDLKNLETMSSIGLVIDSDNSGMNISHLKNHMTIETKYSRDFMLMAEDVSEALRRLPLCMENTQKKYEQKIKEMELEGKIKVVMF